jgi:hypothetical protein
LEKGSESAVDYNGELPNCGQSGEKYLDYIVFNSVDSFRLQFGNARGLDINSSLSAEIHA